MKPTISFQDLVSLDRWQSFEEHAKIIDASLTSDIEKVVKQNYRIKNEVRDLLKNEFEIKKCLLEDLQWAEKMLFSGKVVAIDGTHAVFQLLAGVRCQVGVATTNYENKCTVGAVFVSEQQVTGEETSILGILKRRKKLNKLISRMLIQAVMFYIERAKAIERAEEWVMINGDLVPQPLRTGIGSFRALTPCLEVCRRLIDSKKVVSVVANSQDHELLSLGLALEPGEFIKLRSYKDDLDEYLETSGLRGNDRKEMEQFNNEYGDRFYVGVYRAGGKSYVFHAPKDNFDEAARIVIKDSMFQPIRSYPLLIDYADALCHRMLPGSDFKRMVEFKLAKGKILEAEQDEHELRRR